MSGRHLTGQLLDGEASYKALVFCLANLAQSPAGWSLSQTYKYQKKYSKIITGTHKYILLP
jgi:hypothetical protein